MQFVLMFVSLYIGMAQSWEIAMSTGDNLLRFFTNETLTRTIRIESKNITVLAYNEVHKMMLYVDRQTNNDSICGYDLLFEENKCFMQGSGRNIHGLAFDPVTERVFFTDTKENSINWISVKPGFKNKGNGNLLIKMDDGIPRDIVVDSCRRYIYWLHIYPQKATIDRVRLNGTKRKVIKTLTSIPLNSTYSYEPNSLAIDLQVPAIYWMEAISTKEYCLFTVGLNYTYRHQKSVVHYGPMPSKPKFNNLLNTLSVSKNFFISKSFINTVYTFSKTFTKKKLKMVYGEYKPISIIANYEIRDQIQGFKGCESLRLVKIATEKDGPFCVHGMKDNRQSVCKCTPGYTGKTCHVPVCENYCFHGNCSFNDDGLPECRCNTGYSGKRCEVSVCENYCFQGNCSFNDEGLPECRCHIGYSGKRCEVSACHRYCLNNGECLLNKENQPSCKCVESYEGIRCETGTNNILSNSTTHCSEE